MSHHMSQEEYLEHQGTRCPVCRRNNIRAGEFQQDGSIAWQQVVCLSCKATWVDEYDLIGYYTLEPGEEG